MSDPHISSDIYGRIGVDLDGQLKSREAGRPARQAEEDGRVIRKGSSMS